MTTQYARQRVASRSESAPGPSLDEVSWLFALERTNRFEQSAAVETMEKYRRQALKLAVVKRLGEEEGFAARIPGFRGLIATGDTKRQALSELETALADWIDLALKRGLGLPPVMTRSVPDLITAP